MAGKTLIDGIFILESKNFFLFALLHNNLLVLQL